MGRRREGLGRAGHIGQEGHAQLQRHGVEGLHMQRRGHGAVRPPDASRHARCEEDAELVSMGDTVVVHVRQALHDGEVVEEEVAIFLVAQLQVVVVHLGRDVGKHCPVEEGVLDAILEQKCCKREGEDTGRGQGQQAVVDDAGRSKGREPVKGPSQLQLGAQRNLDTVRTSIRALNELHPVAFAHNTSELVSRTAEYLANCSSGSVQKENIVGIMMFWVEVQAIERESQVSLGWQCESLPM